MNPTTLVCLPFAGAGASFFKKWREQLVDGFDIVAVQLPGREERFIEAPLADVNLVVDDAYAQVLPALNADTPLVLFGHSLGAVLAYELAHRFAGAQGTPVAHLFVSGSPAPWNSRLERASQLSDDAFVAQVAKFAGYTHPAIEDPEMRELLLPTLRADVNMHESYVPSSAKPLNIPITSLRGQEDTLVTAADAAAWAQVTTGPTSHAEFEGGHMYLADDPDAVLRLIARQVTFRENP